MSDSRFWVRRYMAEGWNVVPIPRGEKGPRIPNWQNTTFTEEDFGADDNIGVRLGEPSGGLVDVDLDAKEAITAARTLLVQSQRVHGRPSKPSSHYWFVCKELKSTRYTAPDGSVLVELRSTGGQTVLPPSVHPSGETLTWEQERSPMAIEKADNAAERIGYVDLAEDVKGNLRVTEGRLVPGVQKAEAVASGAGPGRAREADRA